MFGKKGKKKQKKITVTIEVTSTDGATTSKTIEVPEGSTIKEALEFHGIPYEKHDVLMGGVPVTAEAVIEGPQTIALNKKKRKAKEPTVEVRERPAGS